MPIIRKSKTHGEVVPGRFFRRYLLRLGGTFLVLIFVPIVLMGVLSYAVITSNIERQIDGVIGMRLQQLEAFLGRFLRDSKSTLFNFGTEKIIVNLTHGYGLLGNRYDFFGRSSQIKLSNPWIESVVFYIPGEFLMWDTKIDYGTRVADLDALIPEEGTQQNIRFATMTNGRTIAELMLSFPLTASSLQRNACLFFLIDRQWLEEEISLLLPFPLSSFYIFDEAGHTIAVVGDFPSPPSEDADGLHRVLSQGLSADHPLKAGLQIMSRQSPETGWRYFVAVDRTYYETRKSRVLLLGLLVAALLLGSGAFVSYRLALVYGNPLIKTILEFREKVHGAAVPDPPKGSGFELLRWYLDLLYEEKIFFQAILEKNRLVLLNGFFRSLLEGDVKESALDPRIFEFAEIRFTADRYSAVVFAFRSRWIEGELEHTRFDRRASMIKTARETASRCGLASLGIDMGLKSMVLIVNHRADQDGSVMKAVQEISQSLEREYAVKLTVVIGPPVGSLVGLRDSHRRAAQIAELHLFNPADRIYLSEDLPGHVELNREWLQRIQGISKAACGKPKETVLAMVQDLVESMQSRPDRGTVVVHCYYLISKTTRELTDAGLPIDGIFADLSATYLSMNDAEDPAAIESLLTAFFQSVLKARDRFFGHGRGRIMEAALAYLAEHCCDPLISLSVTAEAVGVSPQYLSTILRDAGQGGFATHLSLLRLARSVTLLEDTELTLDDVSRAIGYGNRQTYIRKFQEVYGTTPGKYRKLRKSGAWSA